MQKYIAPSWGNPTPHFNIGDISGNYGFGGVSHWGFVLGAFIHGVFIPGAFIPQGIYLTGHSLHGALILRFQFRVLRPRWFCSRGIVSRGSQAIKNRP